MDKVKQNHKTIKYNKHLALQTLLAFQSKNYLVFEVEVDFLDEVADVDVCF